MTGPPLMSAADLYYSDIVEEIDDMFSYQQKSQEVVSNIIQILINESVKRAQNHFLFSQKGKYASKTLALELLTNTQWATLKLENQPESVEPDQDLLLPRVDQWSTGVIKVRDPSEIQLRPNVNPPREERQPTPKAQTEQITIEFTPEQSSISSRTNGAENLKSTKSLPRPTNTTRGKGQSAAAIITKQFEALKRATAGGAGGKGITVDSDMNVIQVQEVRGLASTLVVPKVSTKRKAGEAAPAPQKKGVRVSVQKPAKRKAAAARLIPLDAPVFDEDVPLGPAERIVANPGVTISDGTVTRGRAVQPGPQQLTRKQYEEYLRELQRAE